MAPPPVPPHFSKRCYRRPGPPPAAGGWHAPQIRDTARVAPPKAVNPRFPAKVGAHWGNIRLRSSWVPSQLGSCWARAGARVGLHMGFAPADGVGGTIRTGPWALHVVRNMSSVGWAPR